MDPEETIQIDEFEVKNEKMTKDRTEEVIVIDDDDDDCDIKLEQDVDMGAHTCHTVQEVIEIEDDEVSVKIEPQTGDNDLKFVGIKPEPPDLNLTLKEEKIETEDNILVVDGHSTMLDIKTEIKEEVVHDPSTIASKSNHEENSKPEQSPSDTRNITRRVPIFSESHGCTKWVLLDFALLREMRPAHIPKNQDYKMPLRGPNGCKITIDIPKDPTDYQTEEKTTRNRDDSCCYSLKGLNGSKKYIYIPLHCFEDKDTNGHPSNGRKDPPREDGTGLQQGSSSSVEGSGRKATSPPVSVNKAFLSSNQKGDCSTVSSSVPSTVEDGANSASSKEPNVSQVSSNLDCPNPKSTFLSITDHKNESSIKETQLSSLSFSARKPETPSSSSSNLQQTTPSVESGLRKEKTPPSSASSSSSVHTCSVLRFASKEKTDSTSSSCAQKPQPSLSSPVHQNSVDKEEVSFKTPISSSIKKPKSVDPLAANVPCSIQKQQTTNTPLPSPEEVSSAGQNCDHIFLHIQRLEGPLPSLEDSSKVSNSTLVDRVQHQLTNAPNDLQERFDKLLQSPREGEEMSSVRDEIAKSKEDSVKGPEVVSRSQNRRKSLSFSTSGSPVHIRPITSNYATLRRNSSDQPLNARVASSSSTSNFALNPTKNLELASTSDVVSSSSTSFKVPSETLLTANPVLHSNIVSSSTTSSSQTPPSFNRLPIPAFVIKLPPEKGKQAPTPKFKENLQKFIDRVKFPHKSMQEEKKKTPPQWKPLVYTGTNLQPPKSQFGGSKVAQKNQKYHKKTSTLQTEVAPYRRLWNRKSSDEFVPPLRRPVQQKSAIVVQLEKAMSSLNNIQKKGSTTGSNDMEKTMNLLSNVRNSLLKESLERKRTPGASKKPPPPNRAPIGQFKTPQDVPIRSTATLSKPKEISAISPSDQKKEELKSWSKRSYDQYFQQIRDKHVSASVAGVGTEENHRDPRKQSQNKRQRLSDDQVPSTTNSASQESTWSLDIRSTVSELSQQTTSFDSKPGQNLTKLPEYTSESKTNKWLNVHFNENKKVQGCKRSHSRNLTAKCQKIGGDVTVSQQKNPTVHQNMRKSPGNAPIGGENLTINHTGLSMSGGNLTAPLVNLALLQSLAGNLTAVAGNSNNTVQQMPNNLFLLQTLNALLPHCSPNLQQGRTVQNGPDAHTGSVINGVAKKKRKNKNPTANPEC